MTPRRRHRWAFGARFILNTTIVSGALVALLGGVQLVGYTDLPRSRSETGRGAVRDRFGSLLVEGRDAQAHAYAATSEHVEKSFVGEAFIASEDRRIGEHSGVDVRAVGRALLSAVRSGRFRSGASTMAMQLVRLREGRHPGVHPWHKLRDAVLACRLTQALGRDGVLRAYLDEVPLAPHVVGVEAASRRTFGKSANALTLAEAAVLSVFARAPVTAVRAAGSPVVRDLVARRADGVLAELVRRGVGSRDDRAALPLVLASLVGERAPQVAAPLLSRMALERAGESTLDPRMQQVLASALRAGLSEVASRGVSHGAAILVELPSRRVRAVSSQAQVGATWLDGTLARRQPGSTLKPFLIAAALEEFGSSNVSVQDTPLSFAGEDDVFEPRNYDGRFHGEVPLEDVLARSLNIPTLRVVARLGVARFLDDLHAFGFLSLDGDPSTYGANLALGDAEVTLTELAEAYATLACDGIRRRLCWSEHGGCDGTAHQVVEPDVARIVSRMLDDDRHRSPTFDRDGVFSAPYALAAKTGTSREHRDSWAIGYGRAFLVAVWMGRADGGFTRDVNGARGPGPVVRDVLDALESGVEPFPEPNPARWVESSECLETTAGAKVAACGRTRLSYRRREARNERVQTTRIGVQPSEKPHFVFPADRAQFEIDAARGNDAQGVRVLVEDRAGGSGLVVRDGLVVIAVTPGRAASLPLVEGEHRLTLEANGTVIDVRTVFVSAPRAASRRSLGPSTP